LLEKRPGVRHRVPPGSGQGGPEGIACWFIDTDYNEEAFFVRHAYFLGAGDPYKALKTTNRPLLKSLCALRKAVLHRTARSSRPHGSNHNGGSIKQAKSLPAFKYSRWGYRRSAADIEKAVGRARRTVDGYIADLRAATQMDTDIKRFRMHSLGIPRTGLQNERG
jgi:hypothetical protein